MPIDLAEKQRVRSNSQNGHRAQDESRDRPQAPETTLPPFFGSGRFHNIEDQVKWQEQYAAQNALQPRLRGDKRAHSDAGQRKPEDGLGVSPSAPKVRHLSDQPPRLPVESSTRTGLDERLENLDLEGDSPSSDETFSDNDCADVHAECLQLAQMLHQGSEKVAEYDSRPGPKSGSLGLLQRRIEEQAFQLEMWAHEAELKTFATKATDPDLIIFVGRVLDRLRRRVKRIADCGDVQFRQYQHNFDKPSQLNIEDDSSDDEDNSLPSEDLLHSNFLNTNLQGIELQVRTLHRLRRSVYQAQGSKFEIAVEAHVEDIARYFGTDDACKKYTDGAVLPGDAALRMAREMDAKA